MLVLHESPSSACAKWLSEAGLQKKNALQNSLKGCLAVRLFPDHIFGTFTRHIT